VFRSIICYHLLFVTIIPSVRNINGIVMRIVILSDRMLITSNSLNARLSLRETGDDTGSGSMSNVRGGHSPDELAASQAQ
jgi:hypothetical protein